MIERDQHIQRLQGAIARHQQIVLHDHSDQDLREANERIGSVRLAAHRFLQRNGLARFAEVYSNEECLRRLRGCPA